jgi:hypothetical protein
VLPLFTGVTALANTIPDMRAISSVNLLKNKIPVEQAQELVEIMQAMENLTTLCGLSREETEIDFSWQGRGEYLYAGDAVLIANDIRDMRAMTSLNLSNNGLGAEGAVHVAEAIKVRDRAVVLKPKSCRSDHWFNCCCLLISISTEYGGYD